MKLFSVAKTTEYALLLDIGSGSVSLTVLQLDDTKQKIVWETNERLLFKSLDSVDKAAKQIMSLVAEVMMRFHAEGAQQLNNENNQATFLTLQVSLAAPFAHTISRRAVYKKDKPFIFTKSLLNQLVDSLQSEILQEEVEVSQEVSLVPTARIIIQEYLNGYSTTFPQGQKGTNLELALSSIFLHEYIYKELCELRDKLFPDTEVQYYSFVLMLFYVLKDIQPEMQEYCLINQTLEATELVVVRDGVPTFTTHDGFGIASLVREIAGVMNSPLEEIFASIQTDVFSHQYKKLSASKQKNIDSILDAYEQRIVNLLQQTGDDFTIPKSIYLHTASCTYDFFATRIERGAEKTTGFGHIVHNLDAYTLGSGNLSENKNKSCVELISSHFFHTCAEVVRYKPV